MSNSYKLRIFISTFGNKVLHVDHGIPIEVGAKKRNNFLYSLRDDVKNNISNKNEIFGELTGLYWVWKNEKIKPNDIIGFCHYNKALGISSKKIVKLFEKNKEKNLWITLPSTYIRRHDDEIVNKAFLVVLKEKYPQYYNNWFKFFDKNMEGNGSRPANMFITTGNEFNKYCNFLFSVCFEAEKLLHDHMIESRNMKRYCAFMGERLLAVYLYTNNNEVIDVPMRYKKWYLNLVRKVKKGLGIRGNSRLYHLLKKRFGYKSSYNRNI
jgi:hypothetical protein